MLDRYIEKKGKKLRYGYTTGSCAAAAAKAAVKMLYDNITINTIDIDTPKGWSLGLELNDVKINKKYVSCAVIKDSGDDPDITNGIKIYAKAEKAENSIEIIGGKGVGKVTRKGLSVPVGSPAINPVPMKMIISEVEKVLPNNKGVSVEISIPKGEEIAKKTFNPKLGIVGGISIIGTTGIVEPMSEEALKESLALELSMLKAEGCKKAVFVPGNYGKNFAQSMNVDDKYIIKTSNYVGYMLDKAKEIGIEKILWIGHIGKLSKVAGGIFQTHSSYADCRMEIIAAYCASIGCDSKKINDILNCITTDESIEIIKENKLEMVFNILANKISLRSMERTYNEIEIEAVIFSNKFGILGKSERADVLLEEFLHE